MMKEFDREWNKLKLSDDDLQHLQNIIINKPDAGDVIQGTGGLRKLRIAFPNKGKSGSGRVCYVTFITYDTTYLITVYAKNEKENISKADANAIADIIVKLENNLKGGKNMNVKESIMRGLNEALEYSEGNHSVGRSVTVNKKKEESIKLHIKEEYNEEASSDIMTLLKNIPDKDIDHHETDLYLRKTPEVTKNVINKLPDIYKKNVTTFRDQIDHDIWYEIPFVFPKGKVRKPTKEDINDKVEHWDVYYWDKEDEESYSHKTVHMTKDEVKDYVDGLNAKRDSYDKEHGWWDYELA